MKKPDKCMSIEEVRNEIDVIDKQIIDLIGERFLYVKEIVKYKSNAVDVKAQKRYDEVLNKRKEWAAKKGLSPEVIEEIYKTLIQYFIDEQMKLLPKK
jgi:isochorismate pyruvate lyase